MGRESERLRPALGSLIFRSQKKKGKNNNIKIWMKLNSILDRNCFILKLGSLMMDKEGRVFKMPSCILIFLKWTGKKFPYIERIILKNLKSILLE